VCDFFKNPRHFADFAKFRFLPHWQNEPLYDTL